MNIGDIQTKYIGALDLGQAQEYTAWVVLARNSKLVQRKPIRWERETAIVHAERFAPGTAYADIIHALRNRYGPYPLHQSHLIIDQTAVGRPVLELFHAARTLYREHPVRITARTNESFEEGCQLIPKVDLVGLLQLMLQDRKLKIPSKLNSADVLVDELQQFQIRPQLHSDQPDLNWRERPHDDLVLAVALACWYSERVIREDEGWAMPSEPVSYMPAKESWETY